MTQQLLCASITICCIELYFFVWIKKQIKQLPNQDPIIDQLQQFFDQLTPAQVTLYIGCYAGLLIGAKYFNPLFFIIFFIQGLSLLCDIMLMIKIKKGS